MSPVGWPLSHLWSAGRLARVGWPHLRWLFSAEHGFSSSMLALACSHGSGSVPWQRKWKVVHRGSGGPGLELKRHSSCSLLTTANYKAILDIRTREMKFTSWWEELQNHIVKGMDLGKSGELQSNTMNIREKLLKFGGINFLNKKKMGPTW